MGKAFDGQFQYLLAHGHVSASCILPSWKKHATFIIIRVANRSIGKMLLSSEDLQQPKSMSCAFLVEHEYSVLSALSQLAGYE